LAKATATAEPAHPKIGGAMSDAPRQEDRAEGEYTDSELPLDAELPKEEYDEIEEVVGTNDGLDDDLDDSFDDDEVVVDVVEIVDDDRTYPPGRDTTL
jgi:hypothetical protein